jgi:hypothetical protein
MYIETSDTESKEETEEIIRQESGIQVNRDDESGSEVERDNDNAELVDILRVHLHNEMVDPTIQCSSLKMNKSDKYLVF